MIPGKILSNSKKCQIRYNGQETSVKQPLCEVILNSPNFEWVPCKDGEVPPNAVAGGKTFDGEILYVGEF